MYLIVETKGIARKDLDGLMTAIKCFKSYRIIKKPKGEKDEILHTNKGL